jgi:4-hydroxy-3-polyprenylbenzoate decarboxylase
MTQTPPRSVFLGVTGASGAAYAQRLLAALAERGAEVALCVSDTGVLVLRHELELPETAREDVVRALTERAGAAAVTQVYEPGDLAAPAASGSAAPDAVVVCPCSMSTTAHIALGTSRNLIHRVADVAIKERRRLVVVPRETPLSSIHLRRLLELSEAGAVVLAAMPGFYYLPKSLEDAVDHVVGKTLAALGFEQRLFPPWDGGSR